MLVVVNGAIVTRLTRRRNLEGEHDVLRYINLDVVIAFTAAPLLETGAGPGPVIVEEDTDAVEAFSELVQWHREDTIILLIGALAVVRFLGPGVADLDHRPSLAVLHLRETDNGVGVAGDKSIDRGEDGTVDHIVLLIGPADEFQNLFLTHPAIGIVLNEPLLGGHAGHVRKCLHRPATAKGSVVLVELGVGFLQDREPPGTGIRPG